MGEQEPVGLNNVDDNKAKAMYTEHMKTDKEVFERENTMQLSMELSELRDKFIGKTTPETERIMNEAVMKMVDVTENKFPLKSYPNYVQKKIARDKNIAEARAHFRENEEAYKQQAVNEAKEAGVDVIYPPYTDKRPEDQTPGAEGTPTQPQ